MSLQMSAYIFIAIFFIGMSHQRGNDWKNWTKFELVNNDGDYTLKCLDGSGKSAGTLGFVPLQGNPKVDIDIYALVLGKGVGEALLHHFLTSVITQQKFKFIKSVELEVKGGEENVAAETILNRHFGKLDSFMASPLEVRQTVRLYESNDIYAAIENHQDLKQYNVDRRTMPQKIGKVPPSAEWIAIFCFLHFINFVVFLFWAQEKGSVWRVFSIFRIENPES
ncbi:hypothetical protein Ddc_10186 [Ditylenchus destructor]|nr:hypothetical protein Ddc_10182 [Ditylenchus destructor]KAI1716813.1 hypothetical protein Ddc_10186 [Ditylenchus destructor]